MENKEVSLEEDPHLYFSILKYFRKRGYEVTQIKNVNILLDDSIICDVHFNEKVKYFFDYYKVKSISTKLFEDFKAFNREAILNNLFAEEPSYLQSTKVTILRYKSQLKQPKNTYESEFMKFVQIGTKINMGQNNPGVINKIDRKNSTFEIYLHNTKNIISDVHLHQITIRKSPSKPNEKELHPFLKTLSTKDLLSLKNQSYGYNYDDYTPYSIEDIIDVLNTREHIPRKNRKNSRGKKIY